MGLYKTIFPLVLASASPRRQKLLASLGLTFGVYACPAKEPTPDAGESPADYAARCAAFKARETREALARERELRPEVMLPTPLPTPLAPVCFSQTAAEPECTAILAADTIVVLRGEILIKPKDHDEAFSMLCRLAGRTHEVFTGCALLLPDGREEVFGASTRVTMWNCPEQTLRAYADTEEPMDKAGAYAIQGQGCFLVSRIEGCLSNVAGLSLPLVVQVLLRNGIIGEGR